MEMGTMEAGLDQIAPTPSKFMLLVKVSLIDLFLFLDNGRWDAIDPHSPYQFRRDDFDQMDDMDDDVDPADDEETQQDVEETEILEEADGSASPFVPLCRKIAHELVHSGFRNT